jgi:hypothetical protein
MILSFQLTELCVSALYLAADANHGNLVELLIRFGANPSAPSLVKLPHLCCKNYRDKNAHLEI